MPDMMDIEDKENVPSDSNFSYSKISKRIYNMLPVYFNRKRKRSSDNNENNTASSNVKKTKVVSESNQNQCSNIVTKLLMTLPSYSRSDQDKTNQYSEYLDYMSQRESFD